MKLLYVAIAGLAAVSEVQGRRSRCNRRCQRKKDRSWLCPGVQLGNLRHPDADAETTCRIDDAETARLEALNAVDPLELCAEADAKCANAVELTSPSQCDSESAKNAMYCMISSGMCEVARGEEEEGIQGQRNYGNSDASAIADYTSIMGQAYFSMMPEAQEQEEEEAEEKTGMELTEGQRKMHYLKITPEIKKAFAQTTGGVWNIVVSGGPEYCRDMFPKFPKIVKGKINPSNPNWYMIVKVRNDCVTLLGVIKITRCTCQFLMWGQPGKWPGKSKSSFAAQFGKKIGSVCNYFTHLKGGVAKPPKQPTLDKCNKQQQGQQGGGNGGNANGGNNNKPNNKPNSDCQRDTTDHGQTTVCAEDTNSMITLENAYNNQKFYFTPMELQQAPMADIILYCERCQCADPAEWKLEGLKKKWAVVKGKC